MRIFGVVAIVVAACNHAAPPPPGPSAAALGQALTRIARAAPPDRAGATVREVAALCGAACPCLRDAAACPSPPSGRPAIWPQLDAAARYLGAQIDRAPSAERPALTTQLAALTVTMPATDGGALPVSESQRPVGAAGPVLRIGVDGQIVVEVAPSFQLTAAGLRPIDAAPPPPVVEPTPVATAPGGLPAAERARSDESLTRKPDDSRVDDIKQEGRAEEKELDLGGETNLPGDDPSILVYSAELGGDAAPAAAFGSAWRVTEAEIGGARSDGEPLLAIAPDAPVAVAVWALAERGGALAVVQHGVTAELDARFARPRIGAPSAVTVIVAGRELIVVRPDDAAHPWRGPLDRAALDGALAPIKLDADATIELFIRDRTTNDLVRVLDPLIARRPRFIRIAAPLTRTR